MDFLEFAKERYSVRSFSQQPIEEEKMQKILQAGQVAPTALNFQPQKIYILKSEDALEKIRFLTKYAYNAPVVLLVCADERKAWHSRQDFGFSSGQMDASIVCTHMIWKRGSWASDLYGSEVSVRTKWRRCSACRMKSSRSACCRWAIRPKKQDRTRNCTTPIDRWKKWSRSCSK